MYRISFLVAFIFAVSIVTAQKLEDKTLLTIDGKNYDAGTFMRVYSKNLDIVKDESQKDIDNYIELYVDYRLKLMQAYELKLEEEDAYKKELLNHRTTLAQGYLTDNQVTDALVQEAYDRSKVELKGRHILIMVEPSALPQDTLKAWNRIQDIKKELDKGADFATVARAKSEDPGASNGGDLGWFGPFRMVYEFETAAYNTTPGNYSKPFRTDFGYHIVKIEEKRPARGEVTVAHIMTFDPKESEEKTAAKRIQDIYKQLQETGKFEELAREFSDDLNSANQGGKLNKFGTGGINSTKFEDVAFGLKASDEISQPFESEYGWHIVKLMEKHPVQPFEELKKPLAEKIKKSPRARRITTAFTDKLKKQYKVTINDAELKAIKSNVTDSVLSGTWTNTKNYKNYNTPVMNMTGKSWTAGDFYTYLETQQKKDYTPYKTKEAKIQAAFDGYVESSLIDFYDQNLERDNKDFAFVYNEYKEGILLFNLLENKIWNRAKEDSLGQQQYFEANKEKYIWKRRLDLVLTQNTTEDAAKQVKQMLEKNMPLQEIKDALNTDGRTKVMVSSGTVEENYNRLPDNFKVQLGVSDVYSDESTNFFKVIQVKEIIEPKAKTLDEARGSVINDYQQQLEKDWLSSLRDGRSIKINTKVLKEVKAKLSTRE
ncbi:MAG: peptidylprolyl isomerase [Nonlabens sp.]|nr:peptidylprolyl isomerase [Nonlabens sp.]